jgi:hypothetical protein
MVTVHNHLYNCHVIMYQGYPELPTQHHKAKVQVVLDKCQVWMYPDLCLLQQLQRPVMIHQKLRTMAHAPQDCVDAE